MRKIAKCGLLLVSAALALSVKADQQATETIKEKAWTGFLTAVNVRNQTLTARHGLLTRVFNLGGKCPITTMDKQAAALADLVPGEKVQIHYQEVGGVLVANRVAEQALRYDGRLHAFDPQVAALTMEQAPVLKPFRAPKTFHMAADCKVLLRNGDKGSVADLQPGGRVSVIYNLAHGTPVAYRIRDLSLEFVGTVKGIDLEGRTVEAGEKSATKKFKLADNCRLVLGNEKLGRPKDLQVGQKYRFTYEQVNGINVVDWIAPTGQPSPTETASTK